MNRKQFVLIALALVVIGGLGLIAYRNQNASYKRSDESLSTKLLGNLAVNDVAQLTIKQGTNELNLAKQGDLWRVKERNNYPANFEQIREFLRQAPDFKFAQREKIGQSLLPRLELTPPGTGANAGTLVEFKDKDGKVMKSLLLGKKHMKKPASPSPMGGDEGWPDGRYVMVGTDLNQVGVVANPFSNLEPKPETWINKDFLKVENVRAVSVATGTVTNDWSASRTNATGEFKLANLKAGEEVDNNKVSPLGSVLASASFNDVLPASTDPKTVGLDKPVTASVETFDDFKYQFKLGKGDGENYNLQLTVDAKLPKERTPGKDEKPDDKTKLDKEFADKAKKLEEKLAQEKAFEGWIFNVNKWTVEALLKSRQELMAEKKEEPKPSDAPKVDKNAL